MEEIQDNRRTITMPQEVGPMLYHTSIIFNSLDKDRHEGDYECNVEIIFYRESQDTIETNNIDKVIDMP